METLTGVILEGERLEIYAFLYRRIWGPALESPTASKSVRGGVQKTRFRMERRATAANMKDYFWAAVRGTDKSIRFAEIMAAAGFIRFEDILEEFRLAFPD